MSIMDIFKPTPSSNNNGGDPTNKDNNNNPTGDLNKPNITIDSNGKMPGTTPADANPLAVYSKMFENAANNSEIQAPSFKIDPKVINDVSSKMDFTKGLDAELMTKAQGGDVNSLLQIIKTVGQNAYKASIEHNTSLTDTFLSQRGDYENKQLARGVRNELTSNALSDTPNYQHPVVKKELNRIANQFAAANPDASPQEVAKAAKKYIEDLQNALSPKPAAGTDDDPEGERDWSKYING